MTISRPQRISRIEPPGSLLKSITATTASRRVLAEPSEGGDKYLALVRQLPCLKCGMSPCEAAHVRFASAAFGKTSGLGKKPSDRRAVPLCAGCHRLSRDAQHNQGERQFWAALDLNPLQIAEQLYLRRGDFPAMEMVIVKAIADRRISR